MTISSCIVSAAKTAKRIAHWQVGCLYYLDAMMNGNYKDAEQNGMTIALMARNIICKGPVRSSNLQTTETRTIKINSIKFKTFKYEPQFIFKMF